MRFSVRLNHAVVAAAAIGAAITSTAACSSDSSSATPAMDAGAGADGGGTADGGTLSLYERLGGKAGIESFVKGIVEKDILTDPDLKTFFFNQVASPIPAGHPSGQQITVCFGRFVGAALQADTYPGQPVDDPTNVNNPSHTCRSMVDSHKGANTMLNIGSANFDKFVGYIAAALMPLVKPTATKVGEITQAEFDTLAGALIGQKPAITTPGAPDGGPFVPTLYDRLGGKAGLETFVGNVVTNHILTDADLKTFFFNQVADPIPAGHPSGKQITVCFARFVGAALQADSYPGAPVNDPTNVNNPNHTCRSIVDSHKGANTMLNIGSGNFDKFVGYIAQDLMPLVVATPTKVGEISQAEFDALAGALTGQKDAVTTPGAPSTGPFEAP